MKNRFFRICSMFLVIVLLVNMLPMSVFAEEFRESAAATPEETAEAIDTSEEYIVEEITEKRTEYTKEFLLSSGLHMATVYAEPVHYETDRGWEEIDNTLKTNPDGTYSNTEGIWDISLPQQLSGSESVTIEKDGYTLSFYMDGELNTAEIATYGRNGKNFHVKEAKKTRGSIQKTDWQKMRQAVEFEEMVPKKSKSRLTYADVYENTDIIYDLDSNMFKESIVLDSYSPTLQGYTYTLEVGDMIPVLEEDGQITLYDKDRKNIVMVMPAPFLVDDAQAHSYDVQVQLTGSGSTYTLSYLLPAQWLAAEDRAWPVVLDPAVTPSLNVANIKDRTVAEKKTYAVNWGANSCGYDTDTGAMRFYLMYNNLPCITSSDVVLGAEIQMVSTNDDTGKKLPVEVHKVNSTWTSDSITWANQPGAVDNVEDYAVVNDSNTYKWNITDIVRGWYANKNTGMVFKLSNAYETAGAKNFKQFYSSDYTDQTSYKPILTIFFRNNNGLESYWDYTTSSAGRAGTGYVNNFTGNLTWIHNDIGFDGNRMPVSINHVYNLNDSYTTSDSNNSNDTAGNAFGLGNGWRTNYNQLVYQWNVNSNYYVWEDSDGTDHYFALKDGVYKDEDGLELTLTTTGSGTTKYKITDKDDNSSYFDTNGRLTKMTNNQKTPSSVEISYVSSTSKRISSIKDGANRIYTFTYNSDNLLTRISYKGTGTTVLSYVDFAYKNEHGTTRLGTITYKDGKTCSYTYSVMGLLKSATDVDGYKLGYSYNSGMESWQPYRVHYISSADGSDSGGSLNFSYAHNQTTIKDHDNNVQIMQFNDYGNTTCIQDDEGHAQYSAFAYNTTKEEEKVKQNDPKAKNNQLRLSSDLQNTVGNILEVNSFESALPWSGNTSSVTVNRSSGAAYHGSYSMKMVSSSSSQLAALGPSVSVSPGSQVTFSAYVKTTSSNAYLGLHNYITGSNYYGETVEANAGWVRAEVSFINNTSEKQYFNLCVFTKAAGTTYVDCVQAERAGAASRYNLISNGDFRYGQADWIRGSTFTSADTYTTGTAAVPQLNATVYKIVGSYTDFKRTSQDVAVSGSKGDNFIFAAWAKGNAVPVIEGETNPREFSVRAKFYYTDGTESNYFTAKFNPDTDQWQYAAGGMIADKAYSGIRVQLVYDYNANTAYFDGVQLYKETFGSSFDYYEDGNVKSVTDIQGQKTTYKYSDNNLTQELINGTAEMTYTYDSYHNVKTAKTQEGLIYYFEYDDYGNNTKVYMSGISTELTSRAEYTSNGNYLDKTYDSSGKVTDYTYDANTGVLLSVKYPEDTDATKTVYTYDTMYRIASATAKASCGYTSTGGLTPLSATYTYNADDQLSKIQTGSTAYNFTYGSFGLRTSVKVGTQLLASYVYTDDENRYLNRLDYGNGDNVQYTYDKKGRVTKETYEDGSTVTYIYDNDGALAKVKDSGGAITYYYDLTGRLVKYTDSRSGTTQTVSHSYDKENNLTKQKQTINTATLGIVNRVAEYSYDGDNRLTDYTFGSSDLTYSYDAFNRLRVATLKYNDSQVLQKNLTYLILNNEIGTGYVSQHNVTAANYDLDLHYTYDDNGNILSVSDGTYTTTYEYDQANQLVRENNQAAGYTRVWAYGDSGNIENRRTFSYTTGAVDINAYTTYTNYHYTNSNWGDLLTQYGDTVFSYDNIGNLLSDGTRTYTWKHGRQLATLSDGTATWTYTYNSDGLRTKRTDGTNTYRYTYADGQLSHMIAKDKEIFIAYDGLGQPLSISHNKTAYFYVTNLQGDVVALLDSSGTAVVEYTYDAWGNILSCTGSMASTLGALNPLRYRGYVYDQETGLYYVSSRYYDPEIGRWINADGFVSTGQDITGYNMFAYCGNNPVNRKDPTGQFWITALIVTAVVAVCTVTLSGCSAQPTKPSNYVQENSTNQNCYSYAFDLPHSANPGDYSVSGNSDYMFKDKNIYTPEEITGFIQRDMDALNKSVRVVDSPKDKFDNEYIVAMKTSTIVIPSIGVADYHFAVQLSDGSWADKPGQTPSRWNVLDGAAIAWDLGNIKNYYNTETVYFAVER